MAGRFKKRLKIELDLRRDIDMLLKIEKCVRGGICNVIHHYAKAINKYMRGCDKNKEP